MKKRKYSRSNDIFSIWKYQGFLIILLLALCLVFFTNRITSYFTDQGPDINQALQEYLTSSFASNINNLFLYNIDKPMEDFMNSSAVTSFFFCSPQYPPTDELLTYLRDNLTVLTDESDCVTAAAIYSSASNTFVTSGAVQTENNEFYDLFNTMIYDYNSNSLDKNKVSGNSFNTFLFKYQDYIVFSKDLTTLSGASYATMFFLMNDEAFSSFIYQANDMIPYKVSIYDTHNSLLFSNSDESAESVYGHLLNFTAETSADTSSSGYIYCSSDITGMQYLLEMELIPLPSETTAPPLLYISITICGLLLVTLFFVFMHFIFRKPAGKMQETAKYLEISKPRSLLQLSAAMEQRVSSLVTENNTLKEIIHATASEAVSSLFAKIISGEALEKEEAAITLNNTGYGFQIDDIYIAGILHQTVTEYITAISRQRVLNMLSSIFERFKEKNQCNLCAFLFDEKSFVIVASFPAGTSIAKGKARVNDLTYQINEGISLLNAPMSVAFGHMYNSIWDLSFSYNEAFKSMHYYQAEAAVSADAPSIASLHHIFPSSDCTETEQEAPAEEALKDTEVADPSEQIERRSAQIAQLIWNNREEGLSSLINRTMSIIFDEKKTPQEQRELSKQLLSAVTSHMLSYPFVNDSHLSDVLDELPLQEDLTPEEQQGNLQKALDTLCQDFSDALKKLRNPYILAAQDYIEQNYSNPDLSLEEIAESLKIAPNYLSTIFSKNLGIKLFEYVNEHRLEKSIELLLGTDKTVNDISMECGFGSSRNYIRIFKKYKDNTPGAYRKQHRPQK